LHRYHVFYGLSTNQPPQETWSYTGKDFYDGYDTNRKFLNGQEALNGTLIDMRATFTNLPANYLTRYVFVARLQEQIDALRKPLNTLLQEPENMAAKKNVSKESEYMKIGLLVFALAIFVGWRLFTSDGLSMPKSSASIPAPATTSVPVTPPPVSEKSKTESEPTKEATAYVAQETPTIIEHLLKTYRPRLSTTAYSQETGFVGNIDFYDNFELIETYKIKELHALGVTLIRKPYGVDLIYSGKSFIVSAWRLPDKPEQIQPDPEPVAVSQASPVAQPDQSKPL
jgi:hypothetical protein